jgi:hypothetical protein
MKREIKKRHKIVKFKADWLDPFYDDNDPEKIFSGKLLEIRKEWLQTIAIVKMHNKIYRISVEAILK